MSLNVSLTLDVCPHCGRGDDDVFSANITHNLSRMAAEAGIYEEVWRPEEVGVVSAEQLVSPLTRAIARMKARPDHYRQFNAENGWGLYKHFLPWLEKLLVACAQWPEAKVRTSR